MAHRLLLSTQLPKQAHRAWVFGAEVMMPLGVVFHSTHNVNIGVPLPDGVLLFEVNCDHEINPFLQIKFVYFSVGNFALFPSYISPAQAPLNPLCHRGLRPVIFSNKSIFFYTARSHNRIDVLLCTDFSCATCTIFLLATLVCGVFSLDNAAIRTFEICIVRPA